jgi:chromosome segregation ATPase
LEARCRALEEQVRLAQARAEAATAGQTQMDKLPTLKALREQDALLAATQASNAQLQHELRALQAGDKLAYAQMQAERDRLSAEAFRLRSQVEVLEAQLSGAGALSSDRAAGLENQLEAARAALAETQREREVEDKRWRQECEALREALETADARAEGRSARELARLREERTEAFEAAAAARRLAQRAEEERDALMAALEAGEQQVQTSTADASDTRTQAAGRRAAEPGGGGERGSQERPSRQRETMASLLQPGDEDSVVILRGKLARAAEEQARLQAELREAREAAEQQLAELHDAFSAHRERAAERETELEKALTAARRERSLRPHTRVRDLERELAAVLRRQQTGASTDASARVADVDQAEALLQRLSAEHARTTAERDELRTEKQQQAETQEKLRRHCEELREVRDKLQADHAAAVGDLQQRVDAALALSEKHRTGKDAARGEASRLSAELERLRSEHARQVQRLEDALARRGAAEGTIQGLQLLVERLQDALKRAPSPDALVEAERHRHRAEQECSRLKATLHVAQQYHTPTMQHFTLLQAKVEQLEESAARRELQMKAVVAQRDRAAALAKEEADEMWRRRMMKKVGSWGT